VVRTARGAILADATRLGVHRPDEALFDVAEWRRRGALEERSGGRGTVAFLCAGGHPQPQRWVLRHYRRGGLVAQALGDRYLYTGDERTRAFREWRLLAQLVALGLPVPPPVAARFERSGPLFYRADLVTEELPTRNTLTQSLAAGPLPAARWADVGRCIARFHARGVQHADLNAHNVLLGAADAVYVVDFDRGRLRERGAWEQAVLDRLRRSLVKVATPMPAGRFGAAEWRALEDGYKAGLERTTDSTHDPREPPTCASST